MAVKIAEEEEKEKKKQSHQFCMSPQLRIIYVLVVSTWCGMCVAFPLMGKLIYLRLYYGIETTLMVSDILKHFLSLSLLPAALPPHRKLYVYIYSLLHCLLLDGVAFVPWEPRYLWNVHLYIDLLICGLLAVVVAVLPSMRISAIFTHRIYIDVCDACGCKPHKRCSIDENRYWRMRLSMKKLIQSKG